MKYELNLIFIHLCYFYVLIDLRLERL